MAWDATEAIGFVAGALSSFASVPQAIKIIRTGDAAEVSAKTHFLMLAGASLWIAFAVLRQSPAMMLWNSVWWLTTATVLWLKFFAAKN